MANLIISIIAIALVAVAALMGAYYGGQAFQEAQQKSNINTIITHMNQIAGAWKVKAVESGGSFSVLTAGTTDTRITANLVPAYLNQSPIPPTNILGSQPTAGNDYYVLRTSTTFYDGTATIIDSVLLYVTREFCIAFARQVGGDMNDPVQTPSNRNISGIGLRPIDCYWYDLNANGTMDDASADRYPIIYEVW